ncbi:unnamed protein product, partial [marine sediment metagenome]
INQNVIIGGLGLGLLPSLLSLRSDIKNIVVIELQQEIIDMVKPYLNPKIEIICDDFFEFIKRYGKDKSLLERFFPPKIWKGRKYPADVDVIIADIWSRYEMNKEIERLFKKSVYLLNEYFPYSKHLFWDFEDYYDYETIKRHNELF